MFSRNNVPVGGEINQMRNGKYVMMQYTMWIMDKSNSFPTLVFELFGSGILSAQGSYSGNIHSEGINPIFCGQTVLLSLILLYKHKIF